MAEEQRLIIGIPILIEDLGLSYPTDKSKKKVRYGIFKCDCGNTFKSKIYSVLVLKETISCGCYRKRVKDIFSNNLSERKKVYSKRYRDKNKEKISKQSKLYKKTDIAIISNKNYKHSRRSRIKKGDVTNKQLLELQQSAKTCYWCNKSLKNTQKHIDHYVPFKKGGLHTLSNLVVSCSSCNLSKQAIDPIVFANSVGKLL